MTLELILRMKGFTLKEIIREEEVINTICLDIGGDECIIDIDQRMIQFIEGYLELNFTAYYFKKGTNLRTVTEEDCVNEILKYKEYKFRAKEIGDITLKLKNESGFIN